MAERFTISAGTIMGDKVVNQAGEDLGKIEELMIDEQSGQIAYVVLSFGGFLGMGDKLFAVPWQSLRIDKNRECFVLDIAKDRLKTAPGFDKERWPDFADPMFGREVHEFYNVKPYWERFPEA